MESLYDYQKFAVLYVDDEEMSLKYFTRAFQNQFEIFTASSAREGYQVLEQHRDKIAIIMTDQRMPGEQGVQFLKRARELHPHAIRILTTAYSDVEVAVDAVNSGAIYKYITKPWEVPDLEITLKRALEFFMVQRERDFLLKEKLSALYRMMITDRVLSLGIVAARLERHVRNPMQAVRSFLEVVPDRLFQADVDLQELRNPNFWKEFYAHAQAQLQRITALLSDAVTVTGQNHHSEVDVNQAVAKSLAKQNGRLSEHHITILNQVPAQLQPLLVERERFERLLDLLVQDEILRLPFGSRVIFSARTSREADLMEIEVKDDGPEFSRDAMRAVLDPFSPRTVEYQDFGINLMACYLIVHHHGGKVDIRSENGQGLTLTLTFPTKPQLRSNEDNETFLDRVLSNDAFWERVIAGTN